MQTLNLQESEELSLVRSTAAEIADEYGREYWREQDEAAEFSPEFWTTLGEAGIHGLLIPEKYDGAGMGMREMGTVIEALCSGGCGMAGAMYPVTTGIMAAQTIVAHGTEDQKDHYLPGMAAGDRIVAVGITEPEAGSNTPQTETRAERDGDEFVIEGQKVWTSLAQVADDLILVTRTTPSDEVDRPTDGLSLFLVDGDDPNIEYSDIPKHGARYVPSNEVFLNEVRVDEANLLGELDDGWSALLTMLNPERIAFAAGATGIGKLAAETAIEYANDREVFDGPIGQYQGVQFPITKAYSQLECADLMREKAAVMFDRGESCGYEANLGKAVAVEAGIELVYHSMQAFGGWGYANEYDVERWWREINLMRLAPVTQQMAWNYLGQELGFPRSY